MRDDQWTLSALLAEIASTGDQGQLVGSLMRRGAENAMRSLVELNLVSVVEWPTSGPVRVVANIEKGFYASKYAVNRVRVAALLRAEMAHA